MMKQNKVPYAIENMEKDDIVQAVVIADSFNSNFSALLTKTPLALLPVVGVPLINYTLESLAQSGVHETYLFCCSHVDLIRAHIQKAVEEKASWSVNMVLHIIISETCRSFGDALRDLDGKGLIRGYFILTGVDTISNVQLLPLLEKFKDICKKDKGAVMSLLYKGAVPGHRAQCAGETVLLAADTITNRVYLHQKLRSNKTKEKAAFPTEIFVEHADVAIHSDLVDTHVAICSPSVLPLFADNFDFQTRDDFVKGILMNEEILASTIYWHLLKGDQYAARISNWQMYQTVSQDVIHRWTYPLVPDLQQTYMMLRNNVYRNKDVTLGKGCKLEEDVVIAKGCCVGENTTVTRSIIGDNCRIGKDCHISDSFIMEGVVVPDKCHIDSSVIATGFTLEKESKIVGHIKGPEIDIGAKEIDLSQKAEAWDNESVDSDENNDGPIKTWWDQESLVYSSSSEDESSQNISPVPDDSNLFLQEVVDSLARGYEEKLNCDYLILEINSSRYAYNMALQEVNFYVIRAIFSLPPMKAPTNIMATFKELIIYFKPIIVNYIKGSDAMMDCLKATEESCSQDPALVNCIAKVVHLLYEKDIVTEDAIMTWHTSLLQENNSLGQQAGLTKLIEWLQEASEESEDSD